MCKKEDCEIKLHNKGSTGSLHKHLKIHGINVEKRKSNSGVDDPHKKVTSISDYMQRVDSTPVVISRLVARDGIPMGTLVTSQVMRRFFSKDGLKLYKSPNSIRTVIMEFYSKIVSEYTEEMKADLVDDQKYSITTDEWTSNRNRRFMNVNVHGREKIWGLGLTRVFGSAPAEKCYTIMSDTLIKFGLTLNNIAAVTTDGAPVMVKMGKSLNATNVIHQLCYAHGRHLAVCDVLYKSRNIVIPITDDDESLDDLQAEIDEEGSDCLSMINGQYDPEQLTDTGNLSALISKVRKTVCIFRNSPCKNDEIFNSFRPESQKNKTLKMDCKTRWNSLVEMVDRFIEMRSTVEKSVPHLKSDKIAFTDEEFETLISLLGCLKPIQIAATANNRTC